MLVEGAPIDFFKICSVVPHWKAQRIQSKTEVDTFGDYQTYPSYTG